MAVPLASTRAAPCARPVRLASPVRGLWRGGGQVLGLQAQPGLGAAHAADAGAQCQRKDDHLDRYADL